MTPLDKAIERAGGVSRLAAGIEVGQSVVSNWKLRGTIIDAKLCVRIERFTGVTRQELRASDWWEVWPELVVTPTPVDAAASIAVAPRVM